MGLKNSSETRVRPVFNHLLDRWPTGAEWLSDLCRLAAVRRPGALIPDEPGHLIVAETPGRAAARLNKVFERAVPPPGDFLRWLLEHPQSMHVADSGSYGAKSATAQAWRKKLFSNTPELRQEAQSAAIRELTQIGADHSRTKWWAFEGFTHIDCCLITSSFVLFIEGKRTESVSPSTQWFTQRSQLWRNVEGARAFAGPRDYGVILGVENESDGVMALSTADSTLDASLPHLSSSEREDLSRHLLGFVTWTEIIERFDLPATCLPETTKDVENRISGTIAGIDGCAGGWVVASSDRDLSNLQFTVIENIGEVIDSNLQLLAVDIPIGLPEAASRGCDVAARQALGAGQGSRVFPAPCRATLGAADYATACELNRSVSGKAISKQAHAILPKITEVDEWLTPQVQDRVREVHPEVSFRFINGKPLVYSKATKEGRQERLDILQEHGLRFDPISERRSLGSSLVAIDDILDAAVALLTCSRILSGEAVRLGDGERDARELLMEIVA